MRYSPPTYTYRTYVYLPHLRTPISPRTLDEVGKVGGSPLVWLRICGHSKRLYQSRRLSGICLFKINRCQVLQRLMNPPPVVKEQIRHHRCFGLSPRAKVHPVQAFDLDRLKKRLCASVVVGCPGSAHALDPSDCRNGVAKVA